MFNSYLAIKTKTLDFIKMILIGLAIAFSGLVIATRSSTEVSAACTPTALSLATLVKNQATDVYTVNVVNTTNQIVGGLSFTLPIAGVTTSDAGLSGNKITTTFINTNATPQTVDFTFTPASGATLVSPSIDFTGMTTSATFMPPGAFNNFSNVTPSSDGGPITVAQDTTAGTDYLTSVTVGDTISSGTILPIAAAGNNIVTAEAPAFKLTYELNLSTPTNMHLTKTGVGAGQTAFNKEGHDFIFNGTGCLDTITPPTGADLSLSKVSNVTTQNVGSNVEYTITVANAGPDTAVAPEVTDILPSGLTFVSGTPAPTVSGSTLTWALADLASGSDTVITYIVTATAAGINDNSAAVSSSTTDGDATNNSSTVSIEVTSPPSLDVTINQNADQSDPTLLSSVGTTSIIFDVSFSDDIDTSTLAVSDISLGGTATTCSALDIQPQISGDVRNFSLTVACTGSISTPSATVSATIASSTVSTSTGSANTASTSTDNEVTILKPLVDPVLTHVNNVAQDGTNLVNTPMPLLTGTGEPNGIVSINDQQGSSICSNVAVNSTGSWSCTSLIPLLQGGNNIFLSEFIPLFSYTTSTLPYVVTLDSIILNPIIIAPSCPVTSSSHFTVFRGTSEPGSDILLDIENENIHLSTTANSVGEFSVSTPALIDGIYQVSIHAVDQLGNVSSPVSCPLTVSTQAPSVSVEQASDQDDPTSANTATFHLEIGGLYDASTFDQSDLTILNTSSSYDGYICDFTDNGNHTYEVTVCGLPNHSTTTILVEADRFLGTNGVGNSQSVSVDNQVTYSVENPTIDYLRTRVHTPIIRGSCTSDHDMRLMISGQAYDFSCPSS